MLAAVDRDAPAANFHRIGTAQTDLDSTSVRRREDSREPAWSLAMLIIETELVSQLLTMEGCIRVQEEAFKKSATPSIPII
jgi:hypothetical protein